MSRLVVSLAVFAAVALGVCGAVFRAAEALGVPAPEVALDAVRAVEVGLAPLQERGGGDGDGDSDWHVGFLGDSMLISYPERKRVPARLQQALERRSGRAANLRVYSLASPGTGPFDYYFVSDLVAAASPDQVILPVNLTAFSNGWREAFARPQLAGFISPSRLPEAFALPLEWIGLTADRVLGYQVAAQLAGAEVWRDGMQEQARVGGARSYVSRALSERFGNDSEAEFGRASFRHHERRIVIPNTRRLSPQGIQERFGRALAGVSPDDPSLQLLSAAIRVFRSRDIEVLVYTNPTNMDHIDAVGAANQAGIARTLASIEQVSKQAGAHFLDLHDLLPDAGFRDFAGHLSVAGEIDGPRILAERLAPALIQAERRARAAGP